MQKHRKYLVVTIWISTIAFVGAGFVGWGTYQYGSKSNSVALVGDVPVTVEQFQRAYADTFARYNGMLGGQLDEATARKLGLKKLVLRDLVNRALIENFAKEYGIVVSDREVQRAIVEMPAFKKNGKFDKQTYIAALQAMRMKPKTFEAALKQDLLVGKTLDLLFCDAVPLETEAFGASLFMADRIRYKILSASGIDVNVTEGDLKTYWKARRKQYMNKQHYKVSLYWIDPDRSAATPEAIEAYYRANRHDFTDANGTVLPLEKVRDEVANAVALQKSKKRAQLAYIDIKKKRKEPQEQKNLPINDPALSAELWQAITAAVPGDVIKPKVVNGRYVVARLDAVTLARPKNFDEAKQEVRRDYIRDQKMTRLTQEAEKESVHLADGRVTPLITRDDVKELPPLSEGEAAQVLEAVFSGQKGHGAVLLGDKAVAYTVLEQQLLDSNKLSRFDKVVKEKVKNIKANVLYEALIKRLEQKYPVQIFIKENE